MNRFLFVFLGVLSATMVLSAEAQPWRAGETFYGTVGVGLAEYSGDYSPSGVPYHLGHFGEAAGFPYLVRGEVGYRVLPQLALGVGLETGNYPFSGRSERLGTRRSAAQLLLRYTYGAETRRLAPYVDVGRVVTFGGVREGHGVSVGLGVDYALTRRVSLNAEARSNTLWPDNATDDRGIGVEGVDHLSQLFGVGVKVDLRAAPVSPRILALEGPTKVEVGDSVAYTARTNEEATRPLRCTWTFGLAASDTVQTATHTFADPGTYTVTFAAQNEAGSTRDSLRVVAVPPPVPPQIVEVQARPRSATVGEPIQFEGRADGDTPMIYEWSFGDGATGTGTFSTHSYDAPGEYTVQATASNEAGRDARELTLTVIQPTAPISGTVTNAETGEPLLNARVRVSSVDAERDTTSEVVETGTGGAYTAAGVPVGPVFVRVAKAGFEPTEQTIDHTAEDTAQVALTLTPGVETAASIERDLAREGRRILENVHFAYDSATIKPGGEETLRAVLEVLRERMPNQTFVIEGHTDSQGAEAYNERLSQRRATAVIEWLIEHGIDADRLEARGMGEAQPIASNDTPEGRRENRRTEIVLVE